MNRKPVSTTPKYGFLPTTSRSLSHSRSNSGLDIWWTELRNWLDNFDCPAKRISDKLPTGDYSRLLLANTYIFRAVSLCTVFSFSFIKSLTFLGLRYWLSWLKDARHFQLLKSTVISLFSYFDNSCALMSRGKHACLAVKCSGDVRTDKKSKDRYRLVLC